MKTGLIQIALKLRNGTVDEMGSRRSGTTALQAYPVSRARHPRKHLCYILSFLYDCKNDKFLILTSDQKNGHGSFRPITISAHDHFGP